VPAGYGCDKGQRGEDSGIEVPDVNRRGESRRLQIGARRIEDDEPAAPVDVRGVNPEIQQRARRDAVDRRRHGVEQVTVAGIVSIEHDKIGMAILTGAAEERDQPLHRSRADTESAQDRSGEIRHEGVEVQQL
jgi:hypothetical protein